MWHPGADGWAGAALQKPLAIQKCDGLTNRQGKVLSYVSASGRIQDSPGQGDNLINWYIEYPYQNNFVRKVPLTVQGYQVVPREQIFVSIGDIL